MQSLNQLLEQTETALLIVDVQNDYCDKNGAIARAGFDVSGVDAMMPNLHSLLEAAHACEMPVVLVQTSHDRSTDSPAWRDRAGGKMKEVCRPGTWGSLFYQIVPAPQDIVITKSRYSAFVNTKLDLVLRALEIKTLIIAGVATNVCVESTARDACMLDYRVVLANDACASFSTSAHYMAVNNIENYFGRSAGVLDIISAMRSVVGLAISR